MIPCELATCSRVLNYSRYISYLSHYIICPLNYFYNCLPSRHRCSHHMILPTPSHESRPTNLCISVMGLCVSYLLALVMNYYCFASRNWLIPGQIWHKTLDVCLHACLIVTPMRLPAYETRWTWPVARQWEARKHGCQEDRTFLRHLWLSNSRISLLSPPEYDGFSQSATWHIDRG